MSTIPTKQIDGDVAVGRNVSAGGNVNIQGNTRIGHNLNVEGWLDAKNIKGPNKGVFRTLAQLQEVYPIPEPGWYALVGITLPAELYIEKEGAWYDTGNTAGNPNIDVSEYNALVQELDERLTAAEGINQSQAEAISGLTSKVNLICGIGEAMTGAGVVNRYVDKVSIPFTYKDLTTGASRTAEVAISGADMEYPYKAGVMTSGIVQQLKTAINNNELQSVSVTADNNSATLTVKSKGKTVTCSVPVARMGGAGFITGEQSQNLDAANKRDNTFPVETVNTLRAGSSLADGYLGGTFNEVETSIREIEHTLGIGSNSQIYAWVTTDTESVQLNMRFDGSQTIYFADAWGDMPELGIASTRRYKQEAALLVDVINSKLYMWTDDQSSLLTVVIETDKGVAGGLAPLGADGKVPAAYLPAQDATIRFAEVVRQPGATIDSGQPAGTFTVVWLDSSAATDYVWKAPGAQETPLAGRFVARVQNIPVDPGPGVGQAESESGGDVGSTVTYHADWEGRSEVCNSNGSPLPFRTYLCTATGRQYDKFPGNNSTGLRCIAAPPMDAKKALFNDLWNEACCNEGWSGSPATRTVNGYYDEDADKWLLNGLTLTYDEAIQVYVAGIIQGTPTGFYWSLHTIRTNMPPRLPTNAGKSWNNTFQGCTNLEVANMGSGIVEGNFWIYGCSKIKKIIGDMRVLNVGVDPSPLSTVPLEEMHLTYFVNSKAAINLKNLPNLNADSLQWMVTNAQVTTQGTRTVTLHADAYARLTDDMKALAAEKSITFVCAS
mgnify:CR=1 FL=1